MNLWREAPQSTVDDRSLRPEAVQEHQRRMVRLCTYQQHQFGLVVLGSSLSPPLFGVSSLPRVGARSTPTRLVARDQRADLGVVKSKGQGKNPLQRLLCCVA
jgi:hypothetical protein